MGKSNKNIHRGELVKQRVEASNEKKSKVAGALGVTTQTLRNYYAKDDLAWDIIRTIGRTIGYDFTNDFPAMPIEVNADEVKRDGFCPKTTNYDAKIYLLFSLIKRVNQLPFLRCSMLNRTC